MIFPQNTVAPLSNLVQVALLDRSQSGNLNAYFFVHGSDVATNGIEFVDVSYPLWPLYALYARPWPLCALCNVPVELL